jgi:hypothetical protein
MNILYFFSSEINFFFADLNYLYTFALHFVENRLKIPP